jgi:hypothetical protein
MSQASRRQFQKFQEDSAMLTTQKKSNPLFPSGRPSHASGRPLVSRRFWQAQHCFHPDVFLYVWFGRQLASIRTTTQQRLDAVLGKEITCRQFTTVQTLRQHCPDEALIWKRVKRVMERLFHNSLSGRSMLPSECHLEKSESMAI